MNELIGNRDGRGQIKVLYLLDCLYGDAGGGSERQFLKLYNYAEQTGVDPFVVFLKDQPIHSELAWQKAPLTLGFSSFFSMSLLSALRQLLKYVDENDIHTIHALFDDACIIAGIIKRLRPHLRLITSQRNIGYNHKGFKVHLLRHAFRRANNVAVNAEIIGDYVVSNLGAEEAGVVTIPNIFEASDTKLNEDLVQEFLDIRKAFSKIAIIVSNLRPVKGIDDLLQAISITKNRNMAYVIIGDGDVDAYREKAKVLGVSECVFILGRRENAAAYMKYADVGILPSQSEGLSNTLIEFMHAKLVIVATSVGGNPGALRDGQLGLLVAHSSPKEMANALDTLISGWASYQGLGDKAYEAAINTYTPKAVCQAYHELYTSKR